MAQAPVDLGTPEYSGLVETGRGGFSIVYRAEQPSLRRTVAIKVLFGIDQDGFASFDRERHAWGPVSHHPNIVQVFGTGFTTLGLPYLVMEYVDSGTLAQRLNSGVMTWPEVLDIGVKLASALETAHRAGVLHRDVKPENVLISAFGEPKLADFGIAGVLDGRMTASGLVAATPAFAAPELFAGQRPSVRSDTYSLACTLFSLLYGDDPWSQGDEVSILTLINRVGTAPLPDLRLRQVPEPVVVVIERAMARDPAQRYGSALEFGEALRQAQVALGQTPTRMVLASAASPVAAPPIPLSVTLPPGALPAPGGGAYPAGAGPGAPPRRRRRGLIVGVAALLVVALVAGILLVSRRPGRSTWLEQVRAGTVVTVAGTSRGFSGDGGPATAAQFDFPRSVAFGPDGALFIVDRSAHRVRRVAPDGTVSTVAGTGEAGSGGDGGPATAAQLNLPVGVAVNGDDVFVTDSGNGSIRKLAGGTLSTVATDFVDPDSVVVAPDGSLLVAEYGAHRIRRIGPDGVTSVVAGTGAAGFSGDGGPATQAAMDRPDGLALAASGDLYVADTGNRRVRRIATNGTITTVAGSGDPSFAPEAVAVDATGKVFVVDMPHSTVARIDAGGRVTVVAGSGRPGLAGDNGPPATVQFDGPLHLAAGAGVLCVADSANARVRCLRL
jgi:hypothetical protein